MMLTTTQLERHTLKSRSDLKALAKKNDVKSARILAREVVRANKQRDRLISSKARVGSVRMQLQNQLGGSLLLVVIMIAFK
jgi:charged multivesicular body protein 3